jgi:DHA2 family methylenomycin A resistance protein-like MFS transporter
MLLGLATGMLFSGLLTALTPHTPYWLFALTAALANFGVSIAVPAMTTAVMQVAGRQHGNSAAAALNANRQIGALVGVAVMGAILHTFAGWNMRTSLAFGFICAMYAVALLLVSRYIASTPRDTPQN